MEKKLVNNITTDNASEQDIALFDEMAHDALQRTPSPSFVNNVMAALPTKQKPAYWLWGSIISMISLFIVWGATGFGNPDLGMSLEIIELESVEFTSITKGFMMINGFLLMLLIDKLVQRRKQMA